MGRVVSFTDRTPPERYDDVPWSEVRVQEAAEFDGPWTLIDTIELDPVDDDPERPEERSFTTPNGTDLDGLWYRLIWADADGHTSEPTGAFQTSATLDLSRIYVTPEALKASLDITNTDFADEDIARALPAASRAVDDICNRFFYRTGLGTNGETRFYTRFQNPRRLDVDDIVSLASVELDRNGDGVYETSLELGVDYVLEPANAPLQGKPWTQILLRRHELPRGPQGIRLNGSFGWLEVPQGVVEATSILAARFVKVIRDAQFGVLYTPGMDTAAAIRLGRTDPHVMMALGNLPKTPKIAP